MDILIWGTGGLASELVRRKYFENATIIGFVDTYKKRNNIWDYRSIIQRI